MRKSRPTIQASLAARVANQWCIPWLEDITWEEADGTQHVVEANMQTWECQALCRLAAIGITPPRAWERELDQRAKVEQCHRHVVQYLYLAAVP